MKKKIVISLFLLILFSLPIILNGENILINMGQVKEFYAEQTEELVVKYKTTNSIAVSWENIQIPETVVKFNLYKNDQFITTVTNKLYVFNSLVSGTSYNLKVNFLDSSDNIVLSKSINDIAPAITIASFNQDMTLTKDTYYVNATSIPAGVTINIEAGSVIKFPSNRVFTVSGTLNLIGTAEDKVTVTSVYDIGNGCDISYYWQNILVNISGVLDVNYTNIRCGGTTYNYGYQKAKYIDSKGILKIKNSNATNVGTQISGEGIAEIYNSTFSNSGLMFSDSQSVDIQNCTAMYISVYYNNQSLNNNVNILNNTLSNEMIYKPNMLSIATIKNNVTTSNVSSVKIYLEKANRDILSNISGNTNTVSPMYGEIQVLTMPTVEEMIFPNRVYYINMANPVLLAGTIINMEAGSTIKLPAHNIFTINGTLNLFGTLEEKVTLTSLYDIGDGCPLSNYWENIVVSESGILDVNYTNIRCGGTTYNYGYKAAKYIENKGILKIRNSSALYVGSGINGSGTAEICNSTFSNSNLDFTDSQSVDIQNCKANYIAASYNNQTLNNNVNILNNTVTNEIIYRPNTLSIATIKNNVTTSNVSSVKIYLENANRDILSNISGNTNTVSPMYGEIQVLTMPTIQEMIFPKRVYYINMANPVLLAGTTMNMEAGSTIKLPVYSTFTINGTLKTVGTAEEKVIITSIYDVGNQLSNSSYWKCIVVNDTGILDLDNTIIKNGGVTRESSYYYTYTYIYNIGLLKIKNSSTSSVGSGISGSGITEIYNSNFNSSNLSFSDSQSVDIQNCTANYIAAYYNNQTLNNNVNILNNTVTNEIIYKPNMLSIATIKNNITTSDVSSVKIYLDKANRDILSNISGNTNTVSPRYGEIQVVTMPTIEEMIFPNRVYYINMSNPVLLVGTSINVEAGSIIKLPAYKVLTINGILKLLGTTEEKVTITSVHDVGNGCDISYYWQNILISESGILDANNATIKYGGTNYAYNKYTLTKYIDNKGIIKIKNSDTKSVGTGIYSEGIVDIIDNNFNNSYLSLFNSQNSNVQNNTIKSIYINYNNQTLENNVNIQNNNINEGISYTPNMLSTATINGNISVSSYPLKLVVENTQPNILKNINNNHNISDTHFEGVYINGITNHLKLSNNNEYIIGVLTVPLDKYLEIEKGTRCKFQPNGSIIVDGNLIINGTIENNVTLTSLLDNNSIYGKGIQVNSTGYAAINNMLMKYCGYDGGINMKYPGIQNNGSMILLNSSLSNLQSKIAVVYNTSISDQELKFNYIGGTLTTNIPLNALANYWGSFDGPKRYNQETKLYEGNGSLVGTDVNWYPFNSEFIKTDLVLNTYINETLLNEKIHFGENGINGYTGNYSKTYDDLNIIIPNIDLKFTRTYNSKNTSSDILGRGWTFGFSSKIDISPLDSNVFYVYLPNGSINTFTKQSDGSYTSNDSRNKLVIENNMYVLITKEQTKYLFDNNKFLNKIVDKYSNETNISVDASGKITKVTDYTGRIYNITYTNNKVSKVVDPMNREVIYNYNLQGLLSEVIGLNGKSTYYEYDVNGYMTYIKEKNDSNEIVTTQTITYLNEGLNGNKVLTLKDESGKIDSYTYNPSERSSTVTDQNNRITKTYYDSKGYPIRIINPGNLQTQITYELVDYSNKYGDIKSRTEVTGQTTTYERDDRGNITKEINSDGSYKTYEYNSKNSLVKETDEVGNITQYIYNTDEVTLLKKILPNNAEMNFEYYTTGIKGLVYKQTDGLGKITTYEYDTYGNITKIINALGNSELYTYNKIGWLLSKTSCEGYVTSYEYDNTGNNTKIIENATVTTVNEYNYKNNLVKTIDANNNITTYEYDSAQNLKKKTDQEGNVTSYEYDIYNNAIKEIKPNGAIYNYSYDNLNRNIKTSVIKDAVETVLEEKLYSYNSGNKTITSKQYINSTDFVTKVQVMNYLDKVTSEKIELAEKTYTYLNNGLKSLEKNEIGKKIYYYYNSLNKVSTKYEEIDEGKYKRTNYEYDVIGNLIKEETSQEKVSLSNNPSSYITTNYSYDDIGNNTLKTTSSREEFKYTYDKDKNIIKEEIKIEDGKYKTAEYAYNYAKKVTSKKEYIEKGSLILNSIDDITLTTLTTSYEYDNMKNVVKETNPEGLITKHYYDKLNRENKTELIKDSKTITVTLTYLYDSKDRVLSKTDGNNNTTTYEYDIFGNILKEIKPNDTITTFEYDLLGNLTKEILPNNIENTQNNTTYKYDKYGNVIEKTRNYLDGEQANKIITTYEYDLICNLLKETTANVSQSSTYNKAGKVITKKDGNNNITTYEYDANLNLIKETNPKQNVIKYYHDVRNNLVKKELDNVIQEEYTYDLLNNKITEKDELGLIITNTYDIDGNLTKQVNNETGYTITNQYILSKQLARTIDSLDKELLYKYDMLNNVIEETEQKIGGNEVITTKSKYDNLSNKIEEIDGNNNVTTYEYDANNQLIKEINPRLQEVTYTYDKNGNKLIETDYLSNTITDKYDNLDRLVEKLDQYNNRIEKLVYDDLGRQIQSIDAKDNTIYFTYDSNNNILTKKDQEGHVETYEYDSLNNKVKYIDKNLHIAKYEYNNKNKLIKVTNALNEVTTYTYDNKGNILTQTDPANNTITYVYDKNSKEIKKIDQLGNEDSKTYYPNGLQETFTTNNGDVFNYTYDIHGRLINENVGQEDITYEYDNNSNKTKIGNIARTYDNLNRLLTNTENSQTVTYTYNDTLKTKTITDPKGNITVEEYDKANRLVKVTNGDDITEYVYNLDGSMQKQINSRTKTMYEYYPDKKLKLLTTKDVNDILIEENYYEYDNNNNIIKDNNKVFTYDALDRIKTSNNTEYTYDTSGNILTKSLLTGNVLKVTGYSYNAKNQLLATTTLEGINVTSESSFTYDDNGNQLTETTNGNTTTNTYNARNELIEVHDGQTVAEYAYNAEGKRVQKVADTTTNFVYDGDNVILELDDQNNEVAINIHGLSLLKRTTDKDGYYVYNGHGDVTKILDNTNNTLNTYEYDEFGKILSENETFNNPYKYARYYYDKDTKTYYLQARYYNPEIQRFISEDTYRGELVDPLSLNLYTYCNNNPLIYVDLTGHWPEWSQLLNEYANSFKTIAATIDGIRDVGNEMITGALSLPYTIGRALGNRIGLDLNNIGYKSGIVGQEQYLKNKTNYLNGLSANNEILKQMPENMVNGFVQNFRTTFDWNNFSNFLDSDTAYNDKKLYAKSAVTTISTLSAVKNIATNLMNGLPQITYTQGPTLQYAGISGSFATAGSLTITPGTLSMKEIFGNMSFIATVNGGGSANNGSKTGPKPYGTGAHNEKIKEIADNIDDGKIIAGGQQVPEKLYNTPGGIKSGRRPDIVVERPDGSRYGINVGKTTKNGLPIKRELDAINDLEKFGKMLMHFVPYK